jgi:hypothetical protein
MRKLGYYYNLTRSQVKDRKSKGILPQNDKSFFFTQVVVEKETNVKREAKKHVPPGMVWDIVEYPNF